MERLRSLQIVRFFAASMVVWCHASMNAAGSAGVDIFFVLSGYIISNVAKNKSPGAFLRDRIIRIFPIYYVCSIPWLFVDIHYRVIDWSSLDRILTTLTLWPVYGGISMPVLLVGWTLSFELLFYVSMAVVLVWKPAAWVLPLAYVLAVIFAYATQWALFRFLGNPIILEFGFGVALSMMRFRNRALGVAAIAAATLCFCWYALHGSEGLDAHVFDLSKPQRVILWGVPAALAVWGALQLDPLTGRISRVLAYLGDASYSLYLTHVFTLLVAVMVFPWPVAIVVAIAVGAAVHQFIEKPLMGVVRSLWRVAVPATAAAG
ncbi:MAG: acyltransferase family protein [Caulobacterales bacterium]